MREKMEKRLLPNLKKEIPHRAEQLRFMLQVTAPLDCTPVPHACLSVPDLNRVSCTGLLPCLTSPYGLPPFHLTSGCHPLP